MGKLYNKNSIESLSPLEFTRLRPGVYCGDTTYSTQLLVEIISNSIDEFRLGHGSEINVGIDGDTFYVRDFGQGFIPESYREDGKTIFEAALSVLNTSGKYREDGTYEGTSLGSFGIGMKIVTYLSHWLKAETYRDGKKETLLFKEGVLEKRECGSIDEKSGTYIQWKPSEEFFTHTEVEIEKVKKLFKTISCLCRGLTINLNCNNEKIKYYSENGLSDLIDESIGNKEIIKNRFVLNESEDKYKIDMVLTYTSDYSSTIIPYVNTGLTESGPHITQIKTALTRELNKFFREKKWLKEKDENLSGEDCQEGLYTVFNLTVPGVSYDAQVKSRIVKIDTKYFIQSFSSAFVEWLNKNEKEIKQIADKAINARKAREAAKKAREAVRNKGEKKNKLLNLPTKLVDAWSKNRMDCELLIAEGDSAAAGLIGARNSETQAVFPIRGKILSTMKATDDKIWSNQEIVNIVKALGLDINPKNRKPIYDINKLRYGRIILCADAELSAV